MIKKIKLLIKRILLFINSDTQKNLVLTAKLLSKENNKLTQISSLETVEFKVFSQNGEDGIIQFIIDKIEIPNKIFIEFGVESYLESNTRLLLMNNEWSGLVMDSDDDFIQFIKKDYVYQKYDLEVKKAFITKDNINELLSNYTKIKDIGLLSIDIDGNDYWIWEAITTINPRVVICEYNATFGVTKKVSIPYQANFNKNEAHFSNLYFGASLNALCSLANKKGYHFIGTCSSGANAFFIRKDCNTFFKPLTSEEGFNKLTAKSSKDKNGKLTFLKFEERAKEIAHLELVEITD